MNTRDNTLTEFQRALQAIEDFKQTGIASSDFMWALGKFENICINGQRQHEEHQANKQKRIER